MSLRVRDIPPGVKFCLVRNGHKFTMIGQHDKHRNLYRVIAHSWTNRFGFKREKQEWTLNGQSYAKPVIRVTLCG